MKILSPVLKERTSGDPWWRTPVTDRKASAGGELSIFLNMAALYKGRSPTRNVVLIRPKSFSSVSSCGSTTKRGGNNSTSSLKI